MSQYTRVLWQDSPSTATPVNAANLNIMDAALDAIGKGTLTVTTGSQATGKTGNQAYTLSTDTLGWVQTLRPAMTNTPTSITLSAIDTNRVSGAITLSYIFTDGFLAIINANATGWARWFGTYTTVGNCLLAVDAETRTFDHHCDHCRQVALDVPFTALAVVADPGAPRDGGRRGRWARFGYRLAVALHLRAPATMSPPAPWLPGHSAVSYQCAHCGVWECFNTGLDAAAEADETLMANPHSTYRVTYGEQARRVRALLRALGKPLIEDVEDVEDVSAVSRQGVA